MALELSCVGPPPALNSLEFNVGIFWTGNNSVEVEVEMAAMESVLVVVVVLVERAATGSRLVSLAFLVVVARSS